MATGECVGMYDDIPFEEYCGMPGMNASTLKWGRHSMLHLKAAIEKRMQRDSVDMGFGRALHAMVLEPDTFESRFRVSHGCCAVLKSGARNGMQCGCEARYSDGELFYCGKHADEDMVDDGHTLTGDEHERVQAACAMLRSNDVYRMLRLSGHNEVTLQWHRDEVLCKARLDKMTVPFGSVPRLIVDVKKCQVGRGGDFHAGRSMVDYGYDMQAAWYVEAVKAVTGDDAQFIWIFIEDDYPFAINAIQADRETMQIGKLKIDKVWQQYLDAMASGAWPGYSDNVHLGGVPEFEREKFRNVLGGM